MTTDGLFLLNLLYVLQFFSSLNLTDCLFLLKLLDVCLLLICSIVERIAVLILTTVYILLLLINVVLVAFKEKFMGVAYWLAQKLAQALTNYDNEDVSSSEYSESEEEMYTASEDVDDDDDDRDNGEDDGSDKDDMDKTNNKQELNPNQNLREPDINIMTYRDDKFENIGGIFVTEDMESSLERHGKAELAENSLELVQKNLQSQIELFISRDNTIMIKFVRNDGTITRVIDFSSLPASIAAGTPKFVCPIEGKASSWEKAKIDYYTQQSYLMLQKRIHEQKGPMKYVKLSDSGYKKSSLCLMRQYPQLKLSIDSDDTLISATQYGRPLKANLIDPSVMSGSSLKHPDDVFQGGRKFLEQRAFADMDLSGDDFSEYDKLRESPIITSSEPIVV